MIPPAIEDAIVVTPALKSRNNSIVLISLGDNIIEYLLLQLRWVHSYKCLINTKVDLWSRIVAAYNRFSSECNVMLNVKVKDRPLHQL